MTEEYWKNSHLSIARFYGQIVYNGKYYIIVDKHGTDIFELSARADKEGRQKAIEPGEPCDLCRRDFIPVYKALGRDRLFELLDNGTPEEVIKKIAKQTNETKKSNE